MNCLLGNPPQKKWQARGSPSLLPAAAERASAKSHVRAARQARPSNPRRVARPSPPTLDFVLTNLLYFIFAHLNAPPAPHDSGRLGDASFPNVCAMTAVPASQNTAPVAEFRCLYTHDLRRKQKRWHDGYLKFHSFNNRVMVYDQSRNFLGDTYYKDSNELHEGDELSLDKGVMVEVAEPMGVTQTDLTPLFEKKTKESPARPSAPSQTRPFQRPTPVAPGSAARVPSQLRHKSLNSLLGTPKGPIG